MGSWPGPRPLGFFGIDQDRAACHVVDLLKYLLTSSNAKLRPILTRQLKPGSRIVSHMHDMGDWEPREVVKVTSGGQERPIYLWVIDGAPDKVIAEAKTEQRDL